MKWSQVFIVLGLAAVISAMTSYMIAPNLQNRMDAPDEIAASDATPDPIVASSTPEVRRAATLQLRGDGHYWARALVNNKASVEFMVDTGASVVALTYRDAQKLGLDPSKLDYNWDIRTAGGVVKGASVVVDSIKINQVHIRNVEAMVLPEALDQSLLGMSFLRELYSYEF
ncbi:MAG: TIGR02281 family clan AA aspartic protease, partial [Pseudomonadota bacterium]